MQTNFSEQILLLQKQLHSSFIPQDNQSSNHDNLSITQNSNKIDNVMKIVINSLKLNQKLYNSIVQKQAKINSNTNSFYDLTSQTDSKIQDALKRTKQLYEDTVHQNQKARFLLQQFLSPIRQELRSKVDQTTFTLQMKMVLDEYDVIGHQISYDVSEEQKVKQQKRKSVNSQTLTFLRDKILPVISNIQKRLQQDIQKGEVMSIKIQQLNTKTKYLQSQLQLQRQIIQQIQRKNIQRINEKMNEQFFDKKMRQTVKFLINQYSQDIHNNMQKIKKSYTNLQTNFIQQIQHIKNKTINFINNQQATQTYFKLQTQKQDKKVQQLYHTFKSHQVWSSQVTHRLNQYHQQIRMIPQIHKKLQDFTAKIQRGEFKSQQHLKGQDIKRIMKKLQQFQIQSKKIKQFQKQSQQKATFWKGQLQGIRDILSKKANFTDILLHIQRKADKRQLKQLRQEIMNEQKDLRSDMKNNSMLVIKQMSQSKQWKKRHIKSRSFFSPSPSQKQGQTINQPQQVKRFKLGFNNQFFHQNETAKKQFSKTQNLRKSIIQNKSVIEQNHKTQQNNLTQH